MLGQAGVRVTIASDGKEGLEALAAQPEAFDGVLMDIQMPVMDGIEATKAIRKSFELGNRKRVPIIALTAHAMGGDRQNFLNAGMDDYLSKPVDKDTLLELVDRHCKIKQ